MRPRPTSTLALLAILSVPAWGCGSKSAHPETVPVHGKVTYKGQPVAKGTITFQSDGGQAATGEIQPDGAYQLSTFSERDGALPGHHKVMIIADDSDPTQMPGSSPGYKTPKALVPKKYETFEKSGLEANVTKDKPDIDFELK